MKYSKILTGLIAIFLFHACYKPNPYNDKDVSSGIVNVLFTTEDRYAIINEEKTIVPNIEFKDSTATIDDFDYYWYEGTVEYSRERILKRVFTTTGYVQMSLIVVHKKTGYRSAFLIQVNLSSKYSSGAFVLYEKNGINELALIAPDGSTFKVLPDLYKIANDNEPLGSQGLFIKEYNSYANAGGRGLFVGQLGGQGPIDINALTMKKVVSLDNAWSSAQPSGFGIKDGNFADNSQYIASADGRLFNRNAGAAVQAMNAPWLSTPVFIPGNGKIGDIWDPFSTGARTPGFSFMHDQANNRLLTLFFTRNTSLPTGAKIDTIPQILVGEYPVGYPKFDEWGTTWQYISGGMYNASNISSGHFSTSWFMLKNNTDNKIYFHTVDVRTSTNNSFESFSPKEVMPFIGESMITPATKFHTVNVSQYLYFTAGANNNELYYFDLVSKNVIKLYHTFDAAITSIKTPESSNKMVVGLENGAVYIFDITQSTLISGTSKQLFKHEGLGKVIDIAIIKNQL